jgi:chromosome segregation ATPase
MATSSSSSAAAGGGLQEAKQELEKAEAKLKEAKEELKEAKDDLREAEGKLEKAKGTAGEQAAQEDYDSARSLKLAAEKRVITLSDTIDKWQARVNDLSGFGAGALRASVLLPNSLLICTVSAANQGW